MSSQGLPFKVDQSTEISAWRVHTFWEKEPETISWLSFFSTDVESSVSLLVDVGANIGLYSLFWLHTRKDATTISCEPFPATRALLLQNLSINGFLERAYVVPQPLASRSAVGTLHSSDSRPGSTGAQFERTVFTGNISEKVKSTTLDHLLLETNDHHILKIDVDGNDFDILQGGVGVLEKNKIKSILIEANMDTQLEIERFLANFGFKPDHRFNNQGHSDTRRIALGKMERNRIYSLATSPTRSHSV